MAGISRLQKQEGSLGETIFHKIIRREIPAEILFEDDKCIVIRDINPVSPTHLLIIPKQDISSINAVEPSDSALIGHLVVVARDMAASLGLKESGYRLVFNNGESAGQTVFQLHLHLLGGREFGWPPG